MAVTLAFLIRLRPGIDPAEFEAFLHDVEVPMLRSWPSTTGQRALRVDGIFEGADRGLAQYLDLIEVGDLDAYRGDLAAAEQSPEFAAFFDGWRRMVDGDEALQTSQVLAWRRDG